MSHTDAHHIKAIHFHVGLINNLDIWKTFKSKNQYNKNYAVCAVGFFGLH